MVERRYWIRFPLIIAFYAIQLESRFSPCGIFGCLQHQLIVAIPKQHAGLTSFILCSQINLLVSTLSPMPGATFGAPSPTQKHSTSPSRDSVGLRTSRNSGETQLAWLWALRSFLSPLLPLVSVDGSACTDEAPGRNACERKGMSLY